MISATLWSSAFFFASLLGFVAIVLRLPLWALLSAGAAAFIALLASDLAVSTLPPGWVEHGITAALVRLVPFYAVLALFNRAGAPATAIMQTLWIWAMVELIFVWNFGQVPSPWDYLQLQMPFYVGGAAAVALILGAARPGRRSAG